MTLAMNAFAADGRRVGTFCVPPTAQAIINNATGLPGPGALILPGTQTLLKLR